MGSNVSSEETSEPDTSIITRPVSNPIAGKTLGEILFVEVLFIIVVGWIMVSLWERVIDNFTFNTLGLNKNSTFHTFIIAVVLTLIFIAYIFSSASIFGMIADEENGSAPVSPVSPISPVSPVVEVPETL